MKYPNYKMILDYDGTLRNLLCKKGREAAVIFKQNCNESLKIYQPYFDSVRKGLRTERKGLRTDEGRNED